MIIQIQKLILIFTRITSFIVLTPGFSYKGFPNIAKVFISFSLTMIVYLMTPDIEVTGAYLLFIILIIKEVLFGLTLGFVSKLFFSASEIAGQFIDFKVGFSMGNIYDPSTGTHVSNYGKVYYWLSITAFFLLNLHHRLIESIIRSFNYVPINHVNIQNLGVEGIVKLFALVFELGFNLAAPLIIVVLLTDIIMGTISRTIPQINVLMLGMPMKILVSILIFLVISSGVLNSIGKILEMMPGYMENFFQYFA